MSDLPEDMLDGMLRQQMQDQIDQINDLDADFNQDPDPIPDMPPDYGKGPGRTLKSRLAKWRDLTPEARESVLKLIAARDGDGLTEEALPAADHELTEEELPDAAQAKAADRLSTTARYDEYVQKGLAAVNLQDDTQWVLGGLAAAVVEDCGGLGALKDWAGDVGIAFSTAREYHRLWIFYDPDARASFERAHTYPDGQRMVHYSHYRDAKVLPTPALAFEWLDHVAGLQYSVDHARAELDKWMQMKGIDQATGADNPPPPKKTVLAKGFLCTAKPLRHTNGEWYLTIRINEDDALADGLDKALRNWRDRPLRLTLSE